jgi:hypothetical protein
MERFFYFYIKNLEAREKPAWMARAGPQAMLREENNLNFSRQPV